MHDKVVGAAPRFPRSRTRAATPPPLPYSVQNDKYSPAARAPGARVLAACFFFFSRHAFPAGTPFRSERGQGRLLPLRHILGRHPCVP